MIKIDIGHRCQKIIEVDVKKGWKMNTLIVLDTMHVNEVLTLEAK